MAIGFPVKADYVTGDVLTAANMNDLSGTLNTIQSVEYAAGKNKIINGDFGVWQRGTSFTNNSSGAYNSDRFKQFYDGSGATRIVSQQTFTPGAAPAAPYESQYFLRFNQSVAGTSGTFNTLTQPIEDVRTFAGNTVTLSYWAKAAATLSLTIEADQGFGSGGSSTVTTSVVSGQTITTSWVRYSHTFTLPSVSGKTIGTSSFVNLSFKLPVNTTFTFDTWGWQLEASSTASDFQTATGTIQGELAACQRYYYRAQATANYTRWGIGQCTSSTAAAGFVKFPITMRTSPTALEQTGTASNYGLTTSTGSVNALSTVPTFDSASPDGSTVVFTVSSGLTAGNATQFLPNGTTVPYLGWSAEL
jgi:hypothetical protein